MATITKPSTSKTRIRRPRSSRPSTRLSAHIPTRSRRLTASSPSYWAPKPQPSTNPQRQQEQQTTIDLARLLHALSTPSSSPGNSSASTPNPPRKSCSARPTPLSGLDSTVTANGANPPSPPSSSPIASTPIPESPSSSSPPPAGSPVKHSAKSKGSSSRSTSNSGQTASILTPSNSPTAPASSPFPPLTVPPAASPPSP